MTQIGVEIDMLANGSTSIIGVDHVDGVDFVLAEVTHTDRDVHAVASHYTSERRHDAGELEGVLQGRKSECLGG